jgi:high frequency lysogenization protein
VSPNARLQAQALSLAAVVESALAVDQLARTGTAPDECVDSLLSSLFRAEWNDIAEIYGGVAVLRRGLETLSRALDQVSDAGHPQALRYVMLMLKLGRRLAADRQRLSVIRERLSRIAADKPADSAGRDRIAEAVADIYKECIGSYPLRIRVTGESAHLRNDATAALIRALLLAGLRAVVLWRHVGGSRLTLLFRRNELREACRKLAATA